MTTPSGTDEPDALGFGYVKKRVKELLKLEDIDEDHDVTQDKKVVWDEPILRQLILSFSFFLLIVEIRWRP